MFGFWVLVVRLLVMNALIVCFYFSLIGFYFITGVLWVCDWWVVWGCAVGFELVFVCCLFVWVVGWVLCLRFCICCSDFAYYYELFVVCGLVGLWVCFGLLVCGDFVFWFVLVYCICWLWWVSFILVV